jgi:hypothetical protein
MIERQNKNLTIATKKLFICDATDREQKIGTLESEKVDY